MTASTSSSPFLGAFLKTTAPVTPELEAAQQQLEQAQAAAAQVASAAISQTHCVVYVIVAVAAGQSFEDQLTVQNGYIVGSIRKAEGEFQIADNEAAEGYVVEPAKEIVGMNARLELTNDQMRELKVAMAKADPGAGGFARVLPCLVEKNCAFTGSYNFAGEEIAHLRLKPTQIDTNSMTAPTLEITSATRGKELARKGMAQSEEIRAAGLRSLSARQNDQRMARAAAARGESTVPMSSSVAAVLQQATDAESDDLAE